MTNRGALNIFNNTFTKEIMEKDPKYIIENLNKDKGATYFIDEEDRGLIVIGNVDIGNSSLAELPVNFSVITGDFNCSNNSLTSLKNCPRVIGKNFMCDSNYLENLDDHPIAVGGYFSCKNNNLSSDLIDLLIYSKEEEKDWHTITIYINSISKSEKLKNLNSKTGLFD